ncbi:MAG: helix-turn-helix domain-containing protein [Pirellulales bacterium]
MNRTTLTPPAVARLWGVSPDKVLNWIRKGDLRAFNVASSRSGRPSYRIDPADLEAFRLSRMNEPPAPERSPRKAKPTNIIEFY